VAVYNEILAGRFNRAVQKLLSMKGPTTLVAVSPDMRMIHPFLTGAENRYLEGWDLLGSFTNIPAGGAGNVQVARLRNPVNSGMIAVIMRAQWVETLATSAGAQISLVYSRGPVTTDQATAVGVMNVDTRSRPASTCIFSVTTAAPVALPGVQNLQMAATAANTSVDLLFPGIEFPLLPGAAFELRSGNQNTPCLVGLFWRERPLEESEKF